MQSKTSREIGRAALQMALTDGRDEESGAIQRLAEAHITAAAVDCGGEFVPAMRRFVERAVVAAKREGVIQGTHVEEGAVAGAAREALAQIAPKAIGLSVGGKVGIARSGDHIAVAAFLSLGLVHLDEVAVGLGHRAAAPAPATSER